MSEHDTIRQALQAVREIGRLSAGAMFLAEGHELDGKSDIAWGASSLLPPVLGLLAKSQADLLKTEPADKAILELLRASAELGNIAEDLAYLKLPDHTWDEETKQELASAIRYHIRQAHARLRELEDKLK